MDEPVGEYLRDGARAGMPFRLAAPRQTFTGAAGGALGRGVGASLEFMEHREYQPGDDLRHVDWGAYGRTDRLIVKRFREEVTPHLDILLDGSKSMALSGTAKARAACGLAAALAAAADNAGYSHCLWLAGRGCSRLPNHSPQVPSWEGLAFTSTASLPESLRLMPPGWRRRGVRVLISDLLWLGEPREVLSPLTDGAAGAAVIQVLAAADADPGRPGNVRLVDSETSQETDLLVDALARRRYLRAMGDHQQNWYRAARQAGGAFVALVAEPLVQQWDLQPLVAAQVLEV